MSTAPTFATSRRSEYRQDPRTAANCSANYSPVGGLLLRIRAAASYENASSTTFSNNGQPQAAIPPANKVELFEGRASRQENASLNHTSFAILIATKRRFSP